jgi:hypothetical protein
MLVSNYLGEFLWKLQYGQRLLPTFARATAQQAISGSPNSCDLKAKAREGAEAVLFIDD